MHIMFARYRETVFRFVQRIVRNPAIADDLVSQVFLDVWRSAKRFEKSLARFNLAALDCPLQGVEHITRAKACVS